MRGVFELQGAMVKSADGAVNKRNVIEVSTADRVYFLQFETPASMDEWLATFENKVAEIDLHNNWAADVDCEGFLDKQNNYSAWQQRWFVLRGTDLAYYTDAAEAHVCAHGWWWQWSVVVTWF